MNKWKSIKLLYIKTRNIFHPIPQTLKQEVQLPAGKCVPKKEIHTE